MERPLEFFTRLLNRILVGKKMAGEWRKCGLVPIFPNNFDVHGCGNYMEE